METRSSTKSKEINTLKFELDQAHNLLKISAEERRKDSEALELFQERVRELELMSNTRQTPQTPSASRMASAQSTGSLGDPELLVSLVKKIPI